MPVQTSCGTVMQLPGSYRIEEGYLRGRRLGPCCRASDVDSRLYGGRSNVVPRQLHPASKSPDDHRLSHTARLFFDPRGLASMGCRSLQFTNPQGLDLSLLTALLMVRISLRPSLPAFQPPASSLRTPPQSQTREALHMFLCSGAEALSSLWSLVIAGDGAEVQVPDPLGSSHRTAFLDT